MGTNWFTKIQPGKVDLSACANVLVCLAWIIQIYNNYHTSIMLFSKGVYMLGTIIRRNRIPWNRKHIQKRTKIIYRSVCVDLSVT